MTLTLLHQFCSFIIWNRDTGETVTITNAFAVVFIGTEALFTLTSA
jgi:hypothetical protein